MNLTEPKLTTFNCGMKDFLLHRQPLLKLVKARKMALIAVVNKKNVLSDSAAPQNHPNSRIKFATSNDLSSLNYSYALKQSSNEITISSFLK